MPKAYPLPSNRVGWGGKLKGIRLARSFGKAIGGAIAADLQEGGIAPLKNSVISRQLIGFGEPGPPLRATAGPSVACFLDKQDGLICGADGRPKTVSLDKERMSWR
jgi:hypothetical protein